MSRLAEEMVIWCSDRFGFISLSDAFTTGSSIMPQKRNPDAAELVRAKPGRIIGALNGLLIVLKGLPLAYGKEMQADKEGVFDAADSLGVAIAATTGMLADMTANPAAMRAALATGFPTATDLADYLVRELGLPFREAHHVSGSIVAMATERGCDLDACRLPTCSPSNRGSPRRCLTCYPARRRWRCGEVSAARRLTRCGRGSPRRGSATGLMTPRGKGS